VLAAGSPAVSPKLVRALETYAENQRHLLVYLRGLGIAVPEGSQQGRAPAEGAVVQGRVVEERARPRARVDLPRLHSARQYNYFDDLAERIATRRTAG
jgi:hypothetical protein